MKIEYEDITFHIERDGSITVREWPTHTLLYASLARDSELIVQPDPDHYRLTVANGEALYEVIEREYVRRVVRCRLVWGKIDDRHLELPRLACPHTKTRWVWGQLADQGYFLHYGEAKQRKPFSVGIIRCLECGEAVLGFGPDENLEPCLVDIAELEAKLQALKKEIGLRTTE